MEFSNVTDGILQGINLWETKLIELDEDTIANKQNSQGRTIKQILGHMVDSASNNTHRIIHMQYQDSPLTFPNYATHGNNDRWIAIQDYQNEKWEDLIQLWKYTHIHIVHVINSVSRDKLEIEWNSESKYGNIKLKDMIIDFLRHFQLHLGEIHELINE